MSEGFRIPEAFRVQVPGRRTWPGDDYGNFTIPSHGGRKLFVIATGGGGLIKVGDKIIDARWEHVSISVRQGKKSRTPTWDEMSKVKRLFWEDTACVVQYHPPECDYVNTHENTLHLWRPCGGGLPRPPKELV